MKPEEIAKTVARGSVEAKLKLYFEYLAAYNLSSGEEEILEPAQLQRIEANYKKHSGRSEVINLAAYFKAFTMLKDRLALYEAQQQYQLAQVTNALNQIEEAINRASLIDQLLKATIDRSNRLDELIHQHGRTLVINIKDTATPNYQPLIDEIIISGKNAIGIATDAAELIALLSRIIKKELPITRLAKYVETLKYSITAITKQIDQKIGRAQLLISSHQHESLAEIAKAIQLERSNEYKAATEYLENSEAIEITPEEIKQFKSLGL
ncbi:MAG: hypothetical protein EBR82_35145 [Caulobacteraceae bacterium]|nr:hypothetical protein [Caulobacteraceae bacterium]